MNTYQARFKHIDGAIITVNIKAYNPGFALDNIETIMYKEWKKLRLTSLKQIQTKRDSTEHSTSTKKENC